MQQIDLYYALFEIITRQEEVINEQNKLIAKLANENLEQENFINVLMKHEADAQQTDYAQQLNYYQDKKHP